MKRPIKKEFENYAKNYKRRKSWQRVVSMLTCIIVFCTTYALILPAITLSGEATCGYEEHVHTDGCYEVLTEQSLTCDPVHKHAADCYENGTLVCGRADFVLHTHNDSCFSESGEMLCNLRKLEEHTHSEACYTVEETVTGHLHSDDCYSVELGEIVCGLEETEAHTHSEGCYGEATLSCTAEENDEHTHSEACYTAELICGLEETEGHTHSDSCHEEIRTLICELEEDGVITEEQVLVCTKPEVTAHTHTENCYETRKNEDGEEIQVLVCTELEVLEHQHSAACLENVTTQGALICAQQEHVHAEACFPEVIEQFSTPVLLADGDSTDETTSDVAVASMSILNVDAEFNASFSNATFDPTHELYDIKLDIEYTLNNDIFQKVAAGEYDAFHIELPDNMIIPDDLLDQVRYATDETQGGMVAFDYWFEKTADGKYVIHIDYRDDYVAEMVKDGSTGTYTISFKGKVEKDAVKNNGDIVLNWSDGTTTTIGKTEIEYPDNETLNYDIHTQKQGSYDIKNNTLTYTVKVYSDKGTPPNETISVTDILNLNGISLPENENPSVSVTDQNGNTVSGANVGYELKDGKPTISVTNLPALNAGGYYLITYTYEIDELAAGTQHWPNNSVTAEVPNPENDEPLESTTGTTVTVSKQMISKTGNYSAENGIITWTITVNASGDNIADYVLTDNMLQNAQSLTIVPADAGSYTLNRVDGKIQSILFNATVDTDNDGTADANYNTYTITYTTAQDQSTAGGYTSNDATLTPPSGSDEKPSTSGDINVWVPASGGIDKQFVDRDGNILNWSVAVTIPDGGIGKGTVIKDNTGYSWDAKADNHWMTPAQIYALNEALSSKLSGIDYTLEFSADGWNWDTYSEAISDTSTTKYYCWRITFNEDVPKDKLDSLTINYSTTADISKANNFVNTAKMGDYSDTANTEYKPAVAKLDRYYNTGTTNISSTDGVIGWYIRVAVDSETTSIDVTDYLPAGVTLTKLGVGTDGNAASSATGFDGSGTTGTLQGWNSVQGNYTISEYTDDNGNTAKQVYIDITPSPADGVFQGTELYVYFECTIDDMPEPGESKSYTFTNKAVVDEVPVEQTQNVTVNIPATVVKMDSNGSIGDTSHSYGANDEKTVGWYVRVYLPEGATGLSDENPIVVTDDLPAGLKLTKIGIGGTMYDARYGKDYSTNPATDLCVTVGDSTSGSLLGTNNAYASTYEITTTDGNQDVVVNITNGGKDIAANSYIYIYYECEITEDAEGETVTSADGLTTTTTYKFENKATVEINGEPFGSDDHEQTIIESTVEEQELPLDKSVNFDAGVSQLQYTVLLNKNGDDLDPDADMIKVVDVMTHNVDRWWNTKHSTLISSSVKLYYPLTDTAGNILYDTDGNPLPDLTREVPADQWSWMFYDNYEDVLNYKSDQIVNTIEAWIPDGYAFVLKYIYAFDIESEWDTGFQVSNKVTLYGKTVTSDEVTSNEIWEYSEVTATATSSGTYTIHKVKEGNYNIVLPNAEFTVYTYSDNQPVQDENGNPVVYKSDNDGLVKISNEDYFQEDVIYYAMETKAPDGYFLPDEPTKIYFYFGGDNAGSLNLPSGAVDLNYTFGVAYIQNKEDDMSITVSKVWPDGAPENFTEVQFQLIQTDVYGNEVVWFVAPEGATEAQINGKYYIIELENSTWQPVTIEHLQAEDLDGHPYTYTIRELNVPDGYVYEVTRDDKGNITITNKALSTNDVTVRKVWDESIPEADRKDIQVQLYQASLEPITKYTAYMYFAANENWWPQLMPDSPFQLTANVTGAGNYEITWILENYGWDPVNNCIIFYLDIFDPYNNLSGYKISDATVTLTDSDGTVTILDVDESKLSYSRESDREDYYRITISSIYGVDAIDPSAIAFDGSMKLNFTLIDSNGNTSSILPAFSYIPQNVTTGGSAYGNPVTLSSSGDSPWEYTWRDLPESGTDSNGNAVYYSYYVKELTEGYKVSYSTDSDGTLVITNAPLTSVGNVSITVDKAWSTSTAPENSVSFDLYKGESSSNSDDTGSYSAEIKSHVDWKIFSPYATKILSLADKIRIVFVGVENDYGGAKIDIWNGGSSNLVSSEELGTHNGNRICRYTFDVSITEDCSVVVFLGHSDYPVGTYTVTDAGGNSVEVTVGIESVTVLEYTASSGGIWTKIGSYIITSDDNWTTTIHDLAPGTYRIVETTTGYSTTYTVGSETSEDPAEITLTAGQTGEVTITNSVDLASITVNKAWEDNGENVSVITLPIKLYQVDSAGNVVLYGNYTMSAPWSLTIDGLPLTDDNGNAYSYYIEEDTSIFPLDANGNAIYKPSYSNGTDAPSGTASDISVGDGGTITITNTAVTSIGVKKNWNLPEGVEETAVRVELWCYTSTEAATAFTVPMTADGEVDYQALLDNPNISHAESDYAYICADVTDGKYTTSYSKTFKNRPLYSFNEDGSIKEYYTYFIVEIADGYIKSYDQDAFITSGRINITNSIETTQIGVNKVWNDGSGTPVDVSLWQVFVENSGSEDDEDPTEDPTEPESTEPTTEHTHTWGGWSVQTPATCTSEGVQIRTCSGCGTTETAIIPVVDHDWDEGVITKDPTETETGIKTYTCKVCGETKTEDIPATGGGSSTVTDLLESTVTVGGSWVDTTIGLTDLDLSYTSGGYFTFEYKITDSSYQLYINLNSWQIKNEQGKVAVGDYVYTIAFDDLPEWLRSSITSITFGGRNFEMTKITWTPASTLSANSISYVNRMLYSDGTSVSSNPLGGTFISTKQVTPGTTTWWTDLPKYKLDENGNILGEYTYYVVETGGDEYDATYAYGSVTGESQMSQGIASGTITITNRNEYHYELPATGGMGTEPYTMGGIFLLMAGCAVLLYNKKKGRKGAHTP